MTETGRSAGGKFAKGNRLSPGRARGSRSKLSESFLADLHKVWLKRGKKALDLVAEKHPETFLRVCATILPRAIEFDAAIAVTHRSELAVELHDFRQAWDNWGKVIGVDQKLIEHIEADDGDPEEQPT
jgi:hypothetical protein